MEVITINSCDNYFRYPRRDAQYRVEIRLIQAHDTGSIGDYIIMGMLSQYCYRQ